MTLGAGVEATRAICRGQKITKVAHEPKQGLGKSITKLKGGVSKIKMSQKQGLIKAQAIARAGAQNKNKSQGLIAGASQKQGLA